MLPRRLFALGFALAVAAGAQAEGPPSPAEEAFERDVRPLLLETCGKCHGAEKQEGALRLDSRDALLKGGENGPAVMVGDPDKSLLIAAVEHSGDLKMPPKGDKLTGPQIAALRSWIKTGTVWPKSAVVPDRIAEKARTHWAFQPVRDIPPPDAATNPIDAFVRERLAKAGLAPSPSADKRTLLRRATYNLTGLPPTAEEVQAFERDEDPRAYEKAVDRLLASPHYGEQWGRHWLDVARYADTKGYVYAREQRFWVHAWVYRDWVVKSLNDDLPFDRFLLLQIAADQVSPNDRSQLAAMGFLTLGRRFLGVTHDIIDDRIDVVTRGTMGLTVSCARCHDHKYDPIPTRDYYSLYGVFQNCAERLTPIAEPASRDAAYVAFEAELQKRQQKLAETLAKRRLETSTRVRNRVGEYLAAQKELHKYPEEGFDQLLAKDDILPSFVRRWQAHLARAAQGDDPIFVPWHAYAALPAEDFATAAVAVNESLSKRPESIHPLVRERFTTAPASMREVADRYGALLREVDQQRQAALKEAADKGQPPPTQLSDAAAESLRRLLYGDGAPCEVPDESMVNIEYFFDLGSCEELWKIQAEVDNWLIQQPLAPAHASILEDRRITVNPRVFKRGRPANKGEEVPRRFLELLSGPDRKPFAEGSGRLELARAIIDPQNPLTARVMVNRVWARHFGAGLVRTPSDFGTRAEPPSHPELLDWLTSRFIEDGWSLKQLHRRIMLSDVYRQSSAPPADRDLLAKAESVDAENRLLWRMNERRLTFEELRDSLFAASQQLDRSLGGKPADMFQPTFRRRALYGLVDRQFLPGALRIFDFANPDLHIPQRSDTTVPQQALFFLNHPLLIGRSQALAARLPADATAEARVTQLYREVYQRAPTAAQLSAAVALVETAEREPEKISAGVADWQYGFAAYDEQKQRTGEFHKLPHFNGTAWQGGGAWPDAKLGWVQLTAGGGHAGNDLAHAAVRRWTAPRDLTVDIRSQLVHDTPQGDGVRGFLVSSRQGPLKSAPVHHSKADFSVSGIELKAGDTLDFIVDIGGTLNNDQFLWETTISVVGDEKQAAWNSVRDFQDQGKTRLTPWEQLAQVLLSANEFVFID